LQLALGHELKRPVQVVKLEQGTTGQEKLGRLTGKLATETAGDFRGRHGFLVEVEVCAAHSHYGVLEREGWTKGKNG